MPSGDTVSPISRMSPSHFLWHRSHINAGHSTVNFQKYSKQGRHGAPESTGLGAPMGPNTITIDAIQN